MNFIETVRYRRRTLGINQSDLAQMSGVSLATIKDIERGVGNPTLDTAQKILEVLGMEMRYTLREVGL